MDAMTHPLQPPTDEKQHQQTYRKFFKLARAAAFATPFLVAFVLYWTT